ncbi:anti-sigma factor family protein [Alkaliphilus serpentinus]|uniref:Zf-HC2 domain-containing protein n=1 Tax=Alkaliphilus serpentinus TaxID=1482731 RepID=A0A833HRJ3_9FIRM|nr:zf-HC2 domain-containing protein [Alkaliphilus serpentinus]KAB3532072.1 zf-HC2 domain-containing protein [Alkaliphilus serpentinus]
MDCQASTNLMMKYLDNHITPQEWADLQLHLMICKDCDEAFKVYQEMLEALETMETPDISDKFEVRVMEAIDHSLYHKKNRQWFGIREVLISFGIYLTFLLAVQNPGWNILKVLEWITRGLYYVSHIFGVIESFLSRFATIFVYSRRLIMLQFQIISNTQITTIMFYFIALAGLTALFFLIEGKLQRLINS